MPSPSPPPATTSPSMSPTIRVALTPRCQTGYMDRAGCHQYIFLYKCNKWVATPTAGCQIGPYIPAVIDWCFDAQHNNNVSEKYERCQPYP
jgi:hypothetical protein